MINEINFEFLSRAFFNITCMMHEYILIITNNEGLTLNLPFLISSRINCSRCSTFNLPFASTSTSLYYHIYQCNYMFVLISTLNELFTSTVSQVYKNSFTNSFTNTIHQVTDTIHQVTNTVVNTNSKYKEDDFTDQNAVAFSQDVLSISSMKLPHVKPRSFLYTSHPARSQVRRVELVTAPTQGAS